MLSWNYVLIVLALGLYLWTMVECGRMRARHQILAPAMVGHPEFERAHRVQMNTLEHLVVFVPALLMCAHLASTMVAAVLGLLWLIGRTIYAVAYRRDPATRGPGFLIALAALAALLVGAGYGAVRATIVGTTW
jgi:uncharacterized MAPEG superfamily protein